ncbi:MAG: DNA translocase FtsK [Candidatus Omnitrophica bacterium]|nr:DNA translocase FtsK [Candidatus Omnitrophota bacterium]
MENVAQKIRAGLIFLLSALLLLSLVSYTPYDLSWYTSDPYQPPHNWIQLAGSYGSGILVFLLGWTSVLVPLVTLIWAVGLWNGWQARHRVLKIGSGVTLILSLPTLLSVIVGNSVKIQMMSSGGIIGLFLGDFLVNYFGFVGGLLIAGTIAALSILVVTDFLAIPFVISMAKVIGSGILWLVDQWLVWVKPGRKTRRIPREKAPKIHSGTGQEKEVPAAASRRVEEFLEETPEAVGPIIRQNVSTTPAPRERKEKQKRESYEMPNLSLLDNPPPTDEQELQEDLRAQSEVLEATLQDFGIEAKVEEVNQGPVITRYELQPAPGVKVQRIIGLSDDVAMAMKASSVRMALIPGSSRLGVEVPNRAPVLVFLKEVLASDEYQSQRHKKKLLLGLGKDTSGAPIVADLGDMPHLLIAGTTGSGKTVCVNTLILSLLYNNTPEELKLILVDPKMVEMTHFNQVPHLICPVVTDYKKVAIVLNWVVAEMERRYRLLASAAARNITLYNEKLRSAKQEAVLKDEQPEEPREENNKPLPYIVVVIDELADLMMMLANEIEGAITRLAQLSRAVGIHIVLATQRPSVDVITGVIKANFPARIAFKVASKVDSRTVLDLNGADKLLGKGDMLFLKPGSVKPIRAQGALVSDTEIERLVSFLKKEWQAEFSQELLEVQQQRGGPGDLGKDDLLEEAIRVVLETGQASASILQRRLRVGYTRAARLVDMMEQESIVGPFRGSKAREILVSREEFESRNQEQEKKEQ